MPRRSDATAAVQAVNERWPGALIKASDPSLRIEHLPTGILSIDCIIGGFARGRHIEIYGGYNVGKTFTTYRFIATSQASGLRCAFLDVEGTFDPAFAEHAGVDLEALEFPGSEEEGRPNGNRLVNIMEALLRSEEYDVVVLDSIAALLPKAEEEMDMESGTMGTHQARLMSAALRRLTAANRNTVCVYINQTRESIGSVFAKRAVTSGGRAMGFYAGTRLEMVRTETIKRAAKTIDHKTSKEKAGEVVKGHRVLVRVEKDKTGKVKQSAETTFVFDYDASDIDPIEDLVYLGRRFGLVKVSGDSWCVIDYEDEKSSGRKRFVKWLRRNRAVAEELEERIRHAATQVDEQQGEAAEAEPTEQEPRKATRKRSGRARKSRKR